MSIATKWFAAVRVAALCVAFLSVAGCSIYERSPLALEAYAESWPDRDIGADSVRAYAETLAGNEKRPPYDPSDGLSLAEAEAVALVFNPQLRLARAQAEVPLASAREAGWWPDPQFEAEVLRFANRGSPERFRFDGPSIDGINTGIIGAGGPSASGIEATQPGYRRTGGDYIDDPWVIGASLSITIPISGRLAVEKEWAWAEYGASWRRILISEWQLLTRLRAAWLAWSTTRERIEATEAYVEQLDAVAATTERLAASGELKPIDARVLVIELRYQETALATLEFEAKQQRLELLAMLGLAPDAPVELIPDLFLPRIDTPESERRDQVLRSDPRVQAVRAAYEAAEQRLRLEIRKQFPDVTVGPSFSLEEGFTRLGFGFGFPIPLWNRNRQAIAEAFAERDAARVRAQTQVEQVISEWARAETRLQFATQRRQMLIRNVVPPVERQVEETRKLLGLGEVNVLLLREALKSAVQAKLDLLDATLAEAREANALQQMLAPRWITPSQAPNEEDNR